MHPPHVSGHPRNRFCGEAGWRCGRFGAEALFLRNRFACAALPHEGNERQYAGSMTPQQEARHIEVEYCALRRFGELRELAIVPRRSEPAPITNHMHVDAFAVRCAFPDERRTGCRPGGNRVRRKRVHEPAIVRFDRFLTDADAVAAPKLPREAWPAGPPLELEAQPAQPMRRGD